MPEPEPPPRGRTPHGIHARSRSLRRPASASGHVVLERPHLDRAGARAGRLGGPAQRLIQVLGLDHPETSDVLLTLGKWTVGGKHVAVPDLDGGGAGVRE